MIKRLFLALAATCFVLVVVPFIFFGFASLMLFDITPLVFMFKKSIGVPRL